MMIYTKLPPIFKPFVSKESVRKVIQAAFDKIKSFVETQVNKDK